MEKVRRTLRFSLDLLCYCSCFRVKRRLRSKSRRVTLSLTFPPTNQVNQVKTSQQSVISSLHLPAFSGPTNQSEKRREVDEYSDDDVDMTGARADPFLSYPLPILTITTISCRRQPPDRGELPAGNGRI